MKTFKDFKEKWPDMFENVYCGFSLPVGWTELVWRLCSLIDWRINGNPYIFEKNGTKKPDVKVVQVKEKFGGLRFYFRGGDETIRAFVTFAEAISSMFCERCGSNEGIRRGVGGWSVETLCKKCAEKKTPSEIS